MGQKHAVWRSYEQRGLDGQYDLRTAFPDYAQYFDRWLRESEKVRQTLRCELDVSYGSGLGDRLDIVRPAGISGAPVNVFFHGGYWRALSKNEFSFVSLGQVPFGAVTVIVNYDLCPSVTIDRLIGQCHAAIDWVRNHIGDHGGNPARIFLSGHSAGAHIVMMMLLTDQPARRAAPAFAGALAISGIYDLEPIRLSFLQSDLRLTPDQVERNSPLLLVRPVDVPVMLAVGELETEEFHRQTNDLALAWRKVGNHCDVMMARQRHHYSILDCFLDLRDPLSAALHRQMGLQTTAKY